MRPTSRAGTSPGPAEIRQRWRVVYRRDPGAAGQPPTQREDLAAWEAGLAASGLPVAGLEVPGGRPRIQFGAPLGAGLGAERELADIFLTRRLTVDVVRAALEQHLPPGHGLVGLHDVWTGEPALPGQVAAADYLARLAPGGPAAARVAEAARRLLASPTYLRERTRGGELRRYDLRPLLVDVQVIEPGPPVIVRIRTRIDPQAGTARPEEVLAALGDLLGEPSGADQLVRERLLLAGEV